MKPSLLSRHWLLVTAFASLGAVATLPLALEAARSNAHEGAKTEAGTVKLVCFDRDMRPNEGTVSTPPSVATR